MTNYSEKYNISGGANGVVSKIAGSGFWTPPLPVNPHDFFCLGLCSNSTLAGWSYNGHTSDYTPNEGGGKTTVLIKPHWNDPRKHRITKEGNPFRGEGRYHRYRIAFQDEIDHKKDLQNKKSRHCVNYTKSSSLACVMRHTRHY